jgi:hypothetical protein
MTEEEYDRNVEECLQALTSVIKTTPAHTHVVWISAAGNLAIMIAQYAKMSSKELKSMFDVLVEVYEEKERENR